MGRIFYLMGKSASGKDTIYRRLLKDCPWLEPVVLYTTRPMRSGEMEGVEYHFTTPEGLEEYRRRGKVIEQRTYETVAGPWTYATVDDGHVGRDDRDYLAIGTLESYGKIRDYFGPGRVVPLYITVEDRTRWERAWKREEQQEKPNFPEMERRFQADEKDFSKENLRKYGIVTAFSNEDLEHCIEEIKAVLET